MEVVIIGNISHLFVNVKHVRALTNGFTNQSILNLENANKIYKALRKRHNVDSSWTLHGLQYDQCFTGIQ